MIKIKLIMPHDCAGLRLDKALALCLKDYSRVQIQTWMENNFVKINDKAPQKKQMVLGGEEISIEAPEKESPSWEAQAIDLDVLFEDDDLLVINKPVGLVVHPGAGNPSDTLLNALLHHSPNQRALPRAGIIHRLDKDTSGLLVIAKTLDAFNQLTTDLKNRTITRIYQTIVCGEMTSGGTIDKPIGRHPIQRKKMAVIDSGKPAITHCRIIERYRGHTRLKVQLETGRTHQIRVHLASINLPIVGDPVYGKRLELPKGASQELINALRQFKRQALHAYELHLQHPRTKQMLHWQAPLPDDFASLVKIFQQDVKHDYT